MNGLWKIGQILMMQVCWLANTGSISSVYGDVIFVTNHDFEDISGESPFNEFTFGPLNGWQLYDPLNVTSGGAGPTYYIGTLAPSPPVFFQPGTFSGQRVGIAFNFFGSGGQGEYGLQQTLSDALQPNTTYTLQVDVGNIASGTSQDNTFFPLGGFPQYRIDLLAAGQVIASDNNSLGNSIAEGTFATSTLQFTSGAVVTPGQLLGIRLVNRNMVDPAFPNSDLEVDFDNVRLTAVSAVPEPGQLGLLAAALMFTLGRIRSGMCSHRRQTVDVSS